MNELKIGEIKTVNTKLLLAIGAFFQNNPGRILAVASILRTDQRVIESQIQGTSMESTIPDGSRIRIRFSDQKSYQVGQVVAFLAGTRIIVHRLAYKGRYGRAKNYLITQGDGKLLPDPPVNFESVLGLVTEFQCEGRWMPLKTRSLLPLIKRFISLLLLVIIAVFMEMNVQLAQWFANQLRNRNLHKLRFWSGSIRVTV